MRRAWFLCLLLSMAVAVGAFVADGSARSRHSPTFVLMRANDEFDVSGANVGCRVVADRSPYPNRLRCFRETSAHSYRPKAGSYAVELGEGAVAVGRIGSNEPVYRRDE